MRHYGGSVASLLGASALSIWLDNLGFSQDALALVWVVCGLIVLLDNIGAVRLRRFGTKQRRTSMIVAFVVAGVIGVLLWRTYLGRPLADQPSESQPKEAAAPVETQPQAAPTVTLEPKPQPSAAELAAELKKLIPSPATPIIERPSLVVRPYVSQGMGKPLLFMLEVTNEGVGAEVKATFDIEEPIRTWGHVPDGLFIAKWLEVKTEWQRIATGHTKYIEIAPPPSPAPEGIRTPFTIFHLNGAIPVGEPFVPIVMTFEAKPDLKRLFRIKFYVLETYRQPDVVWRSDDPKPSASGQASPPPSTK